MATLLLAAPCAILADAKLLEPTWLKIRHLKLSENPKQRFVHFTDLHHKGNVEYLESVIKTINRIAPDFVCFTGDIVEEKKFLAEALAFLSGIKSPLFGVPGNHDYWSQISFEPVKKCFAATGGAWLLDERCEIADGKINLIGITCNYARPMISLNPQTKNILLMHYPAWAKRLGPQKFDLMLAGHSHGGQVRLPLYGSLVVPYDVDEYDLGMFQTPAGSLYVNPGIGYVYDYNFRFNCRPEITVFEI
jgi:predicted MPP superfamily phosphohydrolase